MRIFSSHEGYSVVVVCGLLIGVASLVAEQGLQASGLCGCGSHVPLRQCGIFSLGIESTSPELAGGFLTAEPPGKSEVASF